MIYLIEQSVGSILSHLKYGQKDSPTQPVTENTELHEMLDFINENITEPLTLDFLMKRFFQVFVLDFAYFQNVFGHTA